MVEFASMATTSTLGLIISEIFVSCKEEQHRKKQKTGHCTKARMNNCCEKKKNTSKGGGAIGLSRLHRVLTTPNTPQKNKKKTSFGWSAHFFQVIQIARRWVVALSLG